MLLLLSDSLQHSGLQHARPPSPLPFPEVCPNSCPLHWWCHYAISSSDTFLSFCPRFLPALVSFPVSWLFTSDDQNNGASASASVLPMSIQGWFPLRLTGLISLLLKLLSGEFSSTIVRRHQLFGICLLYGPTLTTICDHWEDDSLDYTDLCQQSNASAFQPTV